MYGQAAYARLLLQEVPHSLRTEAQCCKPVQFSACLTRAQGTFTLVGRQVVTMQNVGASHNTHFKPKAASLKSTDSHSRKEQVMHDMQVWENYEPADETATTSGADQGMNGHASSSSPRETVSVTVTEVASGSQFYVQVCRTHSVKSSGFTHTFLVIIASSEALVMHNVVVCIGKPYA